MEIQKDTLVTIKYKLYIGGFEEELVEAVSDEEPVIFVPGKEEMLEPFEEKLIGLKANDDFKFKLTKEEAYGEIDPEAVAEFPKDIFIDEKTGRIPEEGDYVPMEDEDGNVFDGIAVEIKENSIVIDFNHPLAGEDLYFTGTVIKVEKINNDK